MAITDTRMAPSTKPSSTGVRPLPRTLAVAVASALAVNLLVYAVGRAVGGSFTYAQAGKLTKVDVLSVAVMSAGPLAGRASAGRLAITPVGGAHGRRSDRNLGAGRGHYFPDDNSRGIRYHQRDFLVDHALGGGHSRSDGPQGEDASKAALTREWRVG